MEQKFYRCAKCGQIIAIVEKKDCDVYCCQEKMKEMVPGTSDASKEKHVPVYKVENNKVYVSVGEIPHPQTPEHHIAWVSLQTKFGNQRKKVEDVTNTVFSLLEGDEVEAVYAYCNLHGLWKK